MKTSSYWKKRVELLENANHNNATKYANEISNIYDSATRELEGQLTKWYTRYATNEGITLAEAKRLLNSRELEEFRMDVHEYIKKGQSLDPQWAKQLEGASVRVHVSRLEALKVQTQQLAERTKGYVADSFDEFAVKTYSDQYYKTIFEVQKGAGIGFDITKLDEKQVRKVINKPWAVDGKNFSTRIWGDRTKLVNELHQVLSKGIIQGKAPQKMVNELSKRMNVSKSATARLIYTESSFFANQATLDSYKELGVERYEILATLDTRTSPTCQKMDGQKFNVNEREVGVNYPPFHVFCRTTTVPYFDNEFDIQEERASRDENGDYYVLPASIKYPEWHEAFVNGGSKATLQLKKVSKEVAQLAINEASKELTKLKASMGDKDYAEFMNVVKNNPDVENLYREFANQVDEIRLTANGGECNGRIVEWSYPDPECLKNGQDKFGVLSHEMGHFFDAKLPLNSFTFKEIDTLANNIYSTKKMVSNCDEFLKALQADKLHIKKVFTKDIALEMRANYASGGVQDVIEGLYDLRIYFGHGSEYWNKRYNKLLNASKLNGIKDAEKRLKNVYVKLGFDASNKAKVQKLFKRYDVAGEAFANVMEGVTVGGDTYKYIKTYLPNMCEFVEKLLKELNK